MTIAGATLEPSYSLHCLWESTCVGRAINTHTFMDQERFLSGYLEGIGLLCSLLIYLTLSDFTLCKQLASVYDRAPS